MERTKRNDDDKVWVTISSTINLGNYENFKIEAGKSLTIKKNNNPNELIDDIIDELIEIVDEKGIELKYNKNKKKNPYKKL